MYRKIRIKLGRNYESRTAHFIWNFHAEKASLPTFFDSKFPEIFENRVNFAKDIFENSTRHFRALAHVSNGGTMVQSLRSKK